MNISCIRNFAKSLPTFPNYLSTHLPAPLQTIFGKKSAHYSSPSSSSLSPSLPSGWELTFPSEMTDKIFNYLDLPDIKNTHLASKSFSCHSKRALYKQSYLSVDQLQVQQVAAIKGFSSQYIGQVKIRSLADMEKLAALELDFDQIKRADFREFANLSTLGAVINQFNCLQKMELSAQQSLHLFRDDSFVRSYAFYLRLVSEEGLCLATCPDEIKNDSKIALAAIAQNKSVFSLVGAALKENEEFLLAALDVDVKVFKYFPKKMRKCEKIALKALKKSVLLFACIPHKLKDDKDFFLKALAIEPSLFAFANEELRNDEEVALQALRNGYIVLYDHLGEDLKRNKGFMLKAMAIEPGIFALGCEELRNDTDLALLALTRLRVRVLQYIGDELKDDEQFFLQAVVIKGLAIKYGSERIRNHQQIALLALKTRGLRVIRHVGETVLQDEAFWLQAKDFNQTLRTIYVMRKVLRPIVKATEHLFNSFINKKIPLSL